MGNRASPKPWRGGELSLEQARAIVHGFDRLPRDLDSDQREAVVAQLVELGHEFGPYGLSRLVNRVVEVVAPEVAEDADRRAIERWVPRRCSTPVIGSRQARRGDWPAMPRSCRWS